MRGMASVSTGGRGERRAGYRVKNTTGGGMQPGKDRGREGEERIEDRELSEGEKGGKTKGAT